MQGKVVAILEVESTNCRVIKAISNALSPDNKVVPGDMTINEELRIGNSECVYHVEIIVSNELLKSIKRASSTVNEILLMIKTIEKTQEEIQ